MQLAINFIDILSTVLVIAIFARAILSWFMPAESSPLSRVLLDITEPVLGPIRRVLPPISGIDFSPILAMVLVKLVAGLLDQIIGGVA